MALFAAATVSATACGRLRYDAARDAALADTRAVVVDAPAQSDASDASTAPGTISRLHGSGSVFVYDLALGPEGEVYVVGVFNGELRAGALTTPSLGGCFAARFDADGSAAWLLDVSAPFALCESIDVEGDTLVFVGYLAQCGRLDSRPGWGVVRVDPPSGSFQVARVFFLTRAGEWTTTVTLDGSGNDQVRGVDLSSDRIVLAGNYRASSPGFGLVALPDGRPMPSTEDQGFLISYRLPLAPSLVGWAQPFVGNSDTVVYDAKSDETGVCAVGRYIARLDIGADSTFEGAAALRGFIASFDPLGGLVAVNQDEPVTTFRGVIRTSDTCVALRSGDDSPPVVVVRMDTRTGITSRAEVAAVPTLNIASDFVLSATGVALIPGAYGPGMWSLGATTESFDTRSAIILSLPSDGSASVRRVPLLGEAMAQAVALEADGGLRRKAARSISEGHGSPPKGQATSCSFACAEMSTLGARIACSEYEARVPASSPSLVIQAFALSVISISACGSRAIDATPTGAARGFIEAMRRVDDPHAREEAYLLLCPPAQIALGLRARNAAALGGRMFAPWEMIAEDRALARHVPRRSGAYRERPIEGDAERRAIDISNERGQVQSVPVMLVSGGWCVELDVNAVP